MSATLHPLRSPIDPVIRDLAKVMHQVCAAQGCDWFLTGALAREMLLVHIHGCRPGRKTLDADFALSLSDWRTFDALKAALEATNHFQPDPKVSHRMAFQQGLGAPAMKVDLSPSGPSPMPQGDWLGHRTVAT